MKTLILGIFIFFNLSLIAQSSSNGTGNWNVAGIWIPASIPPDNGDSIVIINSDEVTVNINTGYTQPVVIIVRGTLILDATLTLPSGSQIIIEPGGMVTSGNNGFRLDIGDISWDDFKKDPWTTGILTDVTLESSNINLSIANDNSSKIIFSWNVDLSISDISSIQIEKSTDGVNFYFFENLEINNIGSVSIENDFNSKIVYFRLKVDKGVSSKFSEIVEFENNNIKIQTYPNPFNERISMSTNFYDQKVKIKIIDILGNVVIDEFTNEFVETSRLESGVYFVNVFQNGQLIHNDRMMKK